MRQMIMVSSILGAILSHSAAQANDSRVIVHFKENSSYSTAVKAMQKGKLEKAVKYFERALRRNLSKKYETAAYNNLCAIQYVQRNYSSAEKACENALSTDRLSWRAYVNLANVKMVLGDIDEAQNNLIKARKINPDSQLVQTALSSLEKHTTKLFSENK